MKHGSFLRLLACALACAATPALAQLPTTQLTSIFPPGGKQGGPVVVTVGGSDMDDVEKLVFGHADLTATPTTTPATALEPARPIAGQFSVSIGAGVPPGIYEVRALGRFGISNPRSFVVGTLREIVDAGGNSAPEKALDVPLGSTVSGRVDANAYEFLRLNLKQGERVLIDVAAKRIDSRMDATLVLLGPGGRELARVRDSVGSDPVLDFTAPAAGPYLLKLYDSVYGGGDNYFYRLTVSAAPFVDFVFPPSGPAGTSKPYTLYGRHLPGGQPADGLMIGGVPLEKLEVTIPLPGDDAARARLALGSFAPLKRAWQDGIEFRLPTPAGPANPVAVYFAKAPNIIVEQEPNNEARAAQKITVPCEFVGQFFPQRDLDWVEFEAKKGQTYWIEVISSQLGLACDPYFALYRVAKNDKGEEQTSDIAQVDDVQQDRGRRNNNNNIPDEFDMSNDDPAYKFTVPEDGTYRLLIRDQFGDGRKDPSYVYRLVIRTPNPDFRLLAYPNPPPTGTPQDQVQTRLASASVRRGGAVAVSLAVQRRDEFDGEIVVSVEGLPQGVTCPGAVLGGSVEEGSLVFIAAEDASAWAGPVKVVGKTKIGDREIIREARYAVVVWGTQNRLQQPSELRLSPTLQLGVIDKELDPALVRIGEDKVYETSLGGNVEIPLTITRRGDFKDPVKLVAVGLSQQMRPKDVTLDGSKGEGKFELALNQQNVRPGTYTFYMRAETKRKYVRNPDAVTAAEAELKRVGEMINALNDEVKTAMAAKDEATKLAQDAAAAAVQADQQKIKVATTAKATTDASEQAVDKLKHALEAAALNAASQDLADAVKAAEDATGAAAVAKVRADVERAAAEKVMAAAQAAAKRTDEARVAAEAALKSAQDKANEAKELKTQADKRVADTKQANQPKDLQFSLVSTPIKLRINPSPLVLSLSQPSGPVKQGAKQELVVRLQRLYGFGDQVDLTFDMPQGVQGLTAQKLSLNKDQGEAKLEVAAADSATVGQHACTIRARGRFNNVQVESTATITVNVEAK